MTRNNVLTKALEIACVDITIKNKLQDVKSETLGLMEYYISLAMYELDLEKEIKAGEASD